MNSLQNLEYYANLAVNLSVEDVKSLCILNKELERICKDNNFWIRLFKNRFGNIPEWVPKNIDYRKFYINILSFVEFTGRYMGYSGIPEIDEIYETDLTNTLSNLDYDSIYYLLENDIMNSEYVSI